MQNSFQAWLEILSEHENLLGELETHLKAEKNALLGQDISALKTCTLNKQSSLGKIERFQKRLSDFQKKCAVEAGDETLPLSRIFEEFPTQERRTLQRKREDLARKSRSIERINKFNENCIRIYLEQTEINQNILNMIQNTSGLYTPGGSQPKSSSGKILNRSF